MSKSGTSNHLSFATPVEHPSPTGLTQRSFAFSSSFSSIHTWSSFWRISWTFRSALAAVYIPWDESWRVAGGNVSVLFAILWHLEVGNNHFECCKESIDSERIGIFIHDRRNQLKVWIMRKMLSWTRWLRNENAEWKIVHTWEIAAPVAALSMQSLDASAADPVKRRMQSC